MGITLKIGMNNGSVKSLQEKLIEMNCLPSHARDGSPNNDGIFGEITREAVMAFQKIKGLTVDGIVGSQTLAQIGLAQPAALKLSNPPHILSAAQLQRLAEIIDTAIPTGPLDFFDDQAISWLVSQLDKTIAEAIPPNILAMLNDLSAGIQIPKNRLVTTLNKMINIPLLSEELEQQIIAWVVDFLVDALKVGRTVDSALERLAIKAHGEN